MPVINFTGIFILYLYCKQNYVMNNFKEVSNGTFRGFLHEEEPEYLYIIKSGHINGQGEDNRIFYVIAEDPYEPGKTEQLTKREIKEKYNIEL